jgi:hypothetical protein
LLNVSFNGEKYAKLEHEAQYLEYVWHQRVCKPGQGCAEAVSVPRNKRNWSLWGSVHFAVSLAVVEGDIEL